MSLDVMLNATMTVWRPSSTNTGPLRSEVREYAVHLTGVPCITTGPNALSADAGPGLADLGDRNVYCEAPVDVRALDICEITSGPDAGLRLEVDGPPYRPWNDHTKCRTRFFHGILPSGS